MCGRYTDPNSYDETIEEFSVTNVVPDLRLHVRRYNVAPTMEGLVVFESDGARILDNFFWTFVPPWSKDGKPGKFSAINARDDKIAYSKLYAPSLKAKRCIVPVGGFYEWRGSKRPKQPIYINRPDGTDLGLAGVWSRWKSKSGSEELRSFALVTTSPNDVMKRIHDRMPVILDAADYDAWLDPTNHDTDFLQGLLKPCPNPWLQTRAVSTFVNSPRNDSPKCIEPREDELFPND